MRILALDLGTSMGWAWWSGRRRESGVQTFDLKRGESPGMRYIRFGGWLSATAKWGEPGADVANEGLGPELIIYEQAHQRGGAATEVAAGFSTRVQEFCARHGVEHAMVHSMTLKKFVAGKGHASKEMIVSAVNERWGPPFVTSDDEADAIGLLEYAKVEIVAMETP
jgi:hypothetical protein